jgi:hypothetical protein
MNTIENEVIEEAVETVEVEDVVEETVKDVVEDAVNDTPKGYLTFEAYTEKGGDPDMYRGKKAFAQFYEKSQETKESKAALSDLQSNVKAMAQAMELTKQNELSELTLKLEGELAKNKAEFDFDQYEKTQQQLKAIESKKVEQAPSQGEPPVVTQFRANNPALDRSSPEFDADLNDLVEKRVNEKFQKVNPNAMTEADFNELLGDALTSVKSKFAKYQQVKPKTPPKTRPQSTPKKQSVNNLTDLSPSSRGMYDMLLETSGEDTAKAYLKNITKG